MSGIALLHLNGLWARNADVLLHTHSTKTAQNDAPVALSSKSAAARTPQKSVRSAATCSTRTATLALRSMIFLTILASSMALSDDISQFQMSTEPHMNVSPALQVQFAHYGTNGSLLDLSSAANIAHISSTAPTTLSCADTASPCLLAMPTDAIRDGRTDIVFDNRCSCFCHIDSLCSLPSLHVCL